MIGVALSLCTRLVIVLLEVSNSVSESACVSICTLHYSITICKFITLLPFFFQAILNMLCCCFFLVAKFIYSIVFGSLRRVEEQHMRDKFWNFVFYKFIFVFGVMNVQEMQEMLCWCVWFAVLGTLLLTEQLCKDRFQFVSSLSLSLSPPTS